MEEVSWSRPRAFNHIIESFFPTIKVGCVAYYFIDPSSNASPLNRDFVTYAFLSALRHATPPGKNQSLQPGSKFRVLRDAVLVNPFVGPSQRDTLLSTFSLSQRTYAFLGAAARRRKTRNARRDHTNEDMFLRPLADLPPTATTEIYDDASRTVYTFRISDLIQVIRSSLCAAPDFFVDPQPIRNPYTGVPFTHAQLYTIYNRIRDSPYEIPTVFHIYRRGGFSIRHLLDRAEAFIREEAIDAVRRIHDNQRKAYVTRMLREYNDSLIGIVIHPRFPNDCLMSTFGRYLPTYLRTTLSLHPDLRTRSRLRLQTELSRFAALNPMYGRPRIRAAGSADGPMQFYHEGDHDQVAPRETTRRIVSRHRRRRLASLLEVVGVRSRNMQIERDIIREAEVQEDNETERILGMNQEVEEYEAEEEVLEMAASAEEDEGEAEDDDAEDDDTEMQDAGAEGHSSSEDDEESERSDSPPRPSYQSDITYVPVPIAPPGSPSHAEASAADETLRDAFRLFAQSSGGAGPPPANTGAREDIEAETEESAASGLADDHPPLIQIPPPLPPSSSPEPQSPLPSPTALPRLQSQPPDPSDNTLGPRRPASARRLSHRV